MAAASLSLCVAGGTRPSCRERQRLQWRPSRSLVSCSSGPSAVEVTFEGPAAAGGPAPTTVAVPAGSNLRRVLLDSKLEVYDFMGKVMNCGGGGSCGTCLVSVLEGGDLMSGRTEAEAKFLKSR